MRARLAAPWLIAALATLSCGCAKKGAPSGGPPDLEPPRVVASVPDSGAAGVARRAELSLTFSEGMEPRATGDALTLAPPEAFRRLRWSGRTVRVELEDSLRADQTYTLLVGQGARDRHGNPMEWGATIVFTTADTLPPGRITGRLETVGFEARGVSLWCYDVETGREPDSTARDFDALGISDREGRFRVPGLRVPRRYRLWAFVDQNRNRSFEPETDLLLPVDTTFALTAAIPGADSVVLALVNPRAPGRVSGTVADSLPKVDGTMLVDAVAEADTLRHLVGGIGGEQRFDLQLAPGGWTLRAFKDQDRNRQWNPVREPAGAPVRIQVAPGSFRDDLVLVLGPARTP